MRKSLFGLLGAVGALISVAPAAHALQAVRAPAVMSTDAATLERVELVIGGHPDHDYHRGYHHRPVYHHYPHHNDRYGNRNHGPAIVIR